MKWSPWKKSFSSVICDTEGQEMGTRITEHKSDGHTIVWSAGWSMPGCLPEADTVLFKHVGDAIDYLVDELNTVRQGLEEGSAADRNAEKIIKELDASDRKQETGYTSGALVDGYHYWIDPVPIADADVEGSGEVVQ